jgi:YggT family protein
MLIQIADLLIKTAFGLIIYLALLRFYMQLLRAPFRNPVGQFVMKLTDWAVLPLRRVIPAARGLDLASLVLACIAQLAMTLLLYAVVSGGGLPDGIAVILMLSVLELLRVSVQLLMFVVIIQVVMSWVGQYSPLAPVFDALTRPFYNVFRRIVPPIGNIDLSPLFVVVLAQILLIVIDGLPRTFLVGGS